MRVQPSLFEQFNTGVRQVSFELGQIRREIDALTPHSSFSPNIRQRSSPLAVFGSLAAFIPATLFCGSLPTRLVLSVIFILSLYEAVTMAVQSRPDGHDSPVSGASISFFSFVAIVSIWALSPRVLFTLVLLVVATRALGNAIDRHFPSQPFPHPFPNLCLQKTWFGILGTVALSALATAGAIRIHLLGQGDWSFAGIGLVVVLADLSVAMAKRHHGFHYSSEAIQLSPGLGSRCVQALNRLAGDERGMLDRSAPLIFSAVLLFCLNL